MVKKKRATLNVSVETKKALDVVKATGQSYDGLIKTLLLFYVKQLLDT